MGTVPDNVLNDIRDYFPSKKMAEITLNIFSKNRAMQLDALLKSLENAPYFSQIRVLYCAEDNLFELGYKILGEEYPHISFIPDGNDFPQRILDLVSTSEKYFCWGTDDSIFYRNARLTQDKLDWAFSNGAMAFNLRMGDNIKWQNHWKSEKSEDIIIDDAYIDSLIPDSSKDDVILWDAMHYSQNTDVGRVWQNDASIMPRDLYLEQLNKETRWRFNKSRSLDDLASCGRIFSPCKMAAFRDSVYLNIPVNLVHYLDDGRLYADNFSIYIHYDVNTLNDAFLQGYRIDWKNIDVSNLDCGRREVMYTFTKDGQPYQPELIKT